MPYSHLTNAVIGGSEQYTDHDIEMIQKDVAVRDGDDAIHVEFTDEVESHEGDESGRIEISLNTETGEVEGGENEEQSQEEHSQEEAEGEPEAEENDGLPEFHKIDPKDVTEAGQMMSDAKAGQEEMIRQAIEKGVPEDEINAMFDYYTEHGRLTEGQYKMLAEAGYTKSFIDGYVKGQDAIAEKYARSVMNYCGGSEAYAKVTEHMSKNQPHMVDAFNAAIERNDTATMRALLDACKTSMGSSAPVKPKATQPKRNLAAAAKAKPVQAQVTVEGYKTRAEMVKDMSDPRYGKDAAFRRQVELKVMNAHF